MELFIDSANISEIIECNKMGVIKGVTTNPSLLAGMSTKLNDIVKQIVAVINGPVNVEVLSLSSEDMVMEAKQLVKISSNIIIKIPMGIEGLKAVNELSKCGLKTNVTLIFSKEQAYLAAMAGATYVSPFIGRLEDVGQSGSEIIADIKGIYNMCNIETKIIAASIRNPKHVNEAMIYGADYATVPYKTIMAMCKHNLTDKGIRKFLQDYHK